MPEEPGMPGFLEPIWETVFKVATWSALIFGALSIGSAFVSAWVGWEITDATQKDADKKIKVADERIAESNAVMRDLVDECLAVAKADGCPPSESRPVLKNAGW